MESFFWFTDLLIPLTMIIMGYILYKKPPNDINGVYGYRTRRSKQSIKAWKYANTLCGLYWIKLGLIVLMIVVIDKLLVPMKPENLSIINFVIGIVALIVPIFIIEKKLKYKFHS